MKSKIAMDAFTTEEAKSKPLGLLVKFMAPYKWNILFGLILGIIAVVARLMAPLLIQKISEFLVKIGTATGGSASYHLTSADLNQILIYSVVGIALYVGACICDMISLRLMCGASSGTAMRLRNQMEDKVNSLPLNYYDTRNIGDVLSYFSNDSDIISQTLTLALANFFTNVVLIVGIIVILFVLSWQIALVVVIALPVALFLLILVSGLSQKQFTKRQDALSDVSGQAEEAYTAYNIVRVFRARKRFIAKFNQSNEDLRKSSSNADFLADVMNPIMTCVGNLMITAICLVGSWLVYSRLPQGSSAITEDVLNYIPIIVTAITYGNQLIMPLTQLAQIIAYLSQTAAAAGRVFTFLAEEDQEDESDKTGTIEKIEGNISFEHVRFGYTPDRVIIHDFSEVAKKGQKVAIVGPTGAGKTTMVNLLMRFYDINTGKICIEGVDTKTLNRSYVRSLFGMVLQDTWLFEGTYMENLKYSRRDATDEEVYAACKATHCDEFIRQQPGGYNGMITEECGLSAGQKQLLTIARAMVQNAPMLILDEATSSVDTRTELLIQDAMDKLMKGRTSFVIAHRLSTIKNSDLILVMKDGDVIESGNHDQLMKKNGFYADLYNAQFTGKGPQID